LIVAIVLAALCLSVDAGAISLVSHVITSTYTNRRATTSVISFTAATTSTTLTITAAGGYDVGGCTFAVATATSAVLTGGSLVATSTTLTFSSITSLAVGTNSITMTGCVNTPASAVAANGALWAVVSGADTTSTAAASTAITADSVSSFALSTYVPSTTAASTTGTLSLTFVPSGAVTTATLMTITFTSGFTLSGAASTAVAISGTSTSSTGVATVSGSVITVTMTGLSGSLAAGNTLTVKLSTIVNPTVVTATNYNVTYGTVSGGSCVVEYNNKQITITSAGAATVASLLAMLFAFLALVL